MAPLGGNLLGDTGVPWALGTDAMHRHRRVLVRWAPSYIRTMLAIYPRLINMVHARNVEAVRWLRRAGFVVHPPVAHIGTGEPFSVFEMGESHVR